MDSRLEIVRSLYEGEAHDGALLPDAEARAEYEALRSVKERLDRRVPLRPDAAVVAGILAAAEAPAPRSAPRADRQPVRRRGLRLRMAGAVAAVLAAVGVVGWWQADRSLPTSVPTVAVSVVDTLWVPAAPSPVREAPLVAAVVARPAAAPKAVAEPAALEWDETAAVRDLHQNIEVLESRTEDDLEWDAPAGSFLQSVQSSGARPPSGFQQASERRE